MVGIVTGQRVGLRFEKLILRENRFAETNNFV